MKPDLKKRSRDPEKTRAHILEVAFHEIHQHGFQGVSIDRIIKKTNVTKGAFFHYFATKNDLGYTIVDELLREMILDRWIRPLAAYNNPVQGILNRFRKLADDMSDEDIVRGCPLNNLTQEMSSVDSVFHEKLQAVMLLWIDETERYLTKAQNDGYLRKTTNTRRLAEFIVTVQEGTFAMAKTMNDRKIFSSLYSSLKNYLDSNSEAHS
jgi:AcrR family transcriptional regulator